MVSATFPFPSFNLASLFCPSHILSHIFPSLTFSLPRHMNTSPLLSGRRFWSSNLVRRTLLRTASARL